MSTEDDSSSSSSSRNIIITFDSNVNTMTSLVADLVPFIMQRWCSDDCPTIVSSLSIFYDTPIAFSENDNASFKNTDNIHFVYLDTAGKRSIYDRLCKNLEGKEDHSVIIHNARDYDSNVIAANYILFDNNFTIKWIARILALIFTETNLRSRPLLKEDILSSIGQTDNDDANNMFCGNDAIARKMKSMKDFGPIPISMKEMIEAYVNALTDKDAENMYDSLCSSSSSGDKFCTYLKPRYDSLKKGQEEKPSCGCTR